jgi:hypothetical protein
LSTVVSMLTVDTVTSSRNAVSTREHLFTGWHLKMLIPNGISMAARAQSTSAWWNRSPCDHLKHETVVDAYCGLLRHDGVESGRWIVRSRLAKEHGIVPQKATT